MKPCVICGKLLKKNQSVMTLEYVCSQDCKAERKKSLPKKISILSKEYWINLGYSKEQATQIISQEQRKRSKRCLDYWISRGYLENEAKIKIFEHQSAIGKQNLIKFTKEERQNRSPFSKQYWINRGYSNEESKRIISSNSDTASLKQFISKFGVDVGTDRYNAMCNYRKKRYTLDGFISQYGEQQGKLLWSLKYKNRHNSKKASNFFNKLIEQLDKKYKIYTATNINGEYGVKNEENGVYYFYDFTIPELKLCVEFNGDYWHCNPSKFDPLYEHKQSGLLAKDIWKKDQLKFNTIKKYRGFSTIIVWESDNHAAKIKEILEIINELEKSKNQK